MIQQIFNNDTVHYDKNSNLPKPIKKFLLKMWFNNPHNTNLPHSALATWSKNIITIIINQVVPALLTTYKVPPHMLHLIHILIQLVALTTTFILNSHRISISTRIIHNLPDILKLLCLWCLATILISILCHNRTSTSNPSIIMLPSSKRSNRISSSKLTKDWKGSSPSSQTKCSRYKII